MDSVWDKQDFKREWKHPRNFLRLFLRNIKYSQQRITKGYCDKDVWDIDYWFLNLIPDMLQEFKDTQTGYPGILEKEYVDENGNSCNDECHKEWDGILNHMIFLFREIDEDRCQKKNPYKEEHLKIYEEFTERYGWDGEKLNSSTSINEEESSNRYRRVHFPEELPEYREVEEKYYNEEKKLYEYREQCKEQAFELFSKWFHMLWD